MIKKFKVVVKVIPDIPQGYGTLNPPTEEEYLDTVMEAVNNEGKCRFIKFIKDSEYVEKPGQTIKIPLGMSYVRIQNGEIEQEVPACDLIFKAIIYIEQ